MLNAGYPEYQHHADIHKQLTEQALQLKENYQQKRLKQTAFFSFILDDIIVGHMLKEDVLFFPYFPRKASKGEVLHY